MSHGTVRIHRRTSGWFRWYATCTCGWRHEGGRGAVVDAAVAHAYDEGGSYEDLTGLPIADQSAS